MPSTHDSTAASGSSSAFPQQSRPQAHAAPTSSSTSNAFTELMKPKPKPDMPKEPGRTDPESRQTAALGRDGLVAYTRDPESFPPSRVVYFNEKFVVINDLYPKATVHLLILPRDPKKNVLRAQEAFDNDPEFLADCVQEEKKVRDLAAIELRRRLGSSSAAEKARNDAMEADDPPAILPPGRDWSREIISGTHANPSMNHLHIHVLSRDMHSDCVRKSNHYLSFTTDFLIPMEAYPLAEKDFRRQYHWMDKDMQCWRCGKGFGNRMAKLKQHLDDEFEEWAKE